MSLQQKDYGVGSHGKPETFYTLSLTQVVNPLAPASQIKLKVTWKQVKLALKQHHLYTESSEPESKDLRVLRGVRLIAGLPPSQKSKFMQDYTVTLQASKPQTVDDEDPFLVDFN